MICWFNNKPLQANSKFVIRHTTREARAIVKEINYKVDINTLHRIEDDKSVNMNDIARVRLRTTVPLLFDSYSRNRNTGSIILVDEATNETVAAGMII
jgi:sulfate adenylyltransferase subunit 1